MRRFLLSVVVLVIIFAGPSAHSTKPIIVPYLLANSSELDVSQPDLSLLGQDLERCDVFLSGAEWHGTRASYEVEYALLTALNQQAGVNYLLVASGYGTTQMYNKYLETGDEDLLVEIQSELIYSNASNHEHRTFWQDLYNYNQQLPQEQRITAIGIDLEYEPYTALSYLANLPGAEHIPSLPPPVDLQQTIAHDLEMYEYVSELLDDLTENKAHYLEVLGNDTVLEFERVLSNIVVTRNMDPGDADYLAKREQYRYDNFLMAYDDFAPAKFFGHFTTEHVFQYEIKTPTLGNVDTLAMLLNSSGSPVEDKVLSMAAMYTNSYFRFYFGRYFVIDFEDDILQDREPFIEISPRGYTIYRLTGGDSPFKKSVYTLDQPRVGNTTKYYQYLLVINSSPPATLHTS